MTRERTANGPALVRQLVAAVDQAYDHKSWHGTNLRGSIRGVSARVAMRRPAPGRHNIWENVVHCAYWKYSVWRRLTGQKRGMFPLRGYNWFRRSGPPDEAAWRADIALLGEMHRTLRATLVLLAARNLTRRAMGSRVPIADMIMGIAAHDVYHAGQIQLLKRLGRARRA
jgi:hypothetical protein